MKRGLHTKLVLIMLLLIISLMTVVGAFLIRGVLGFYTNEFYEQMISFFSMPEFVADLRSAADDPEGPAKIGEILNASRGALGINSDSRNYYILDSEFGNPLLSSDPQEDLILEKSPNILTALAGEEGWESSLTQDYMDVALPISGQNNSYIIYIRDNKQTVADLNMELIQIITEALIIGLVISVLLSFLLSKTMITPIQSLTRAAERVSRGDFTQKIEVQTHDEIGVLTQTFNNMAKQLKDTLDDIENERNKLMTVFLHMTDGVVAFSRDGSIMHHNPAAERMLGISLGDKSVNFDTIFGGFVSMDELLPLKSPEYAEFEHNINGMDLEISMAPISGYGAQGGMLAVIHDVTEQKKSDALRREFVANVSHELRTPITNIRSYAETLADSEDLPPDMVKNFLKVIVNESDRMTKIVQDLLTLSRFDSGKADLHFEKFSFSLSVKNVFDAMLMEAKKSGLEMSLEIGENLPDILGDRSRIEQVLLNIISNAVRYTPEGGRISVRAGREDDTVWMEVADTGIGIPPEDLPRIFDRFYRVDKARSRASGGTGLGLSIAKDIVVRHSGNISVESTVGKGTTMTVKLPIEPPVKQ
ncbi:MAG TPA: cell wall metabolism sensor histidine kinase WalK [Clostridiales bacterium]|nr:cell wall metabolism sensor histidine kinase WalK [Clostridiales bacterium]